MKKVKTLLSIFFCMMATALFGACSCSSTNISVVTIKVSEVSTNLVKEEGAERYLVRPGETFTVTYEILPDNATDKTTYIELTPANKITTNSSIIKSNNAKNTIEFKASANTLGETKIEFQTADGGEIASIIVEIIGSDLVYSQPENVKYNTTTNAFEWDKSTVETTSGILEADKYAVYVNDEKIETETNSLPMNLESGKDYFVRVQALGNLAHRTSDSEITNDVRFNILKPVTNLKAKNGEISWDYGSVEDIDRFVLSFGDKEVIISNTEIRSFDLADHITKQNFEGLDNFDVKVVAVNSEFNHGAPNDGNIMTYILDSQNNPKVNLTQLYAPQNLRLNTMSDGQIYSSSVLEWTKVNGVSYNIEVFENGLSIGKLYTRDNFINLSETDFVKDAGLKNYKLKITSQGIESSTFTKGDAVSEFEFVVMPFLEGKIDYKNDNLELQVDDMLNLLGLNIEDISTKLKYEVYHTINQLGKYENMIEVGASNRVNLSLAVDGVSDYNILIRPVPTTYSTKNVVLPAISNSKTSFESAVSQLDSASISKIDSDGFIYATDTNIKENVEAYRFELSKNGNVTTKSLYSNNPKIQFDTENTDDFKINIKELFGISDAGEYQIKVVPTSTKKIDGNANNCTNYGFTQLSNINSGSIHVNNNVITWDAVSNCTKYSISINGTQKESISNSFELLDIDSNILNQTNTIEIRAIGNGTSSISGTSVSVNKQRTTKVSGFEVVDGVLTWEDMVGSKYYITISGTTDKIEVTSNAFNGLDLLTTESQTITVSRAVEDYFNSEESDVITLSRLSTPANDLSVINHTNQVEFTKVSGTTKYKVEIKKAGASIETLDIVDDGSDENKVKFNLELSDSDLQAGQYSIFVQAIPSDQTSGTTFSLLSEQSQENIVVVFSQVTITNQTGKLDWSFANEGGKLSSFTIEFVDDEYSDINGLVENTYSFSEIAEGTYNLSIYANSEFINTIYPVAKTLSITKTDTPTLTLSQGQISFVPVDTASDYEVYSDSGNKLVENVDFKFDKQEGITYILPIGNDANTDYKISLLAIGDTDILDGNKSSELTYQVISGVDASTVVYSNKTFTWNNVEGNNNYIVSLYKGATLLDTLETTNTYTIPDKFFSGADMFTAGEYRIEMIVKSSDKVNSYTTAKPFYKLDIISDIDVDKDENVLSWYYVGPGSLKEFKIDILVDNSGSWEVVDTITQVEYSIDLDEVADYDKFQIMITCIGSDEEFTIDGQSHVVTYKTDYFTKLAVPSFSYADGRIKLVMNAEAQSHELFYIEGGQYYNLTYTMDGDGFIELGDDYSVKTIVAKAFAGTSDYLNSTYSEEVVVKKLQSVNPTIVDKKLCWTAELNDSLFPCANGYLITNTNAEGTSTYDVTDGAVEELDISDKLVESDNVFSIIALGTVKDGICYLNSDSSTAVSIIKVGAISTLSVDDGIVSWDAIEGVENYKVNLYKDEGGNPTYLKSIVVGEANFNVNSLSEINSNYAISLSVVPYSVAQNDYIIVEDPENIASINLIRSSAIKSVEVKDGLLEFTFNLQGVNTTDLYKLAGTSDYSTLDEDFKNKYYNYYNFRIIIGKNIIEFNLNDMSYEINMSQILNGTFKARYNLNYSVSSTTLLNIKVLSVGNIATSTSSYNGVVSNVVGSSVIELPAYKHSAPVPGATNNLFMEDNQISFKKVMQSDGYVTQYILNLYGSTEVLTYEFTTDNVSPTHTIQDILNISFKDENGSTVILSNKKDTSYRYQLTTKGDNQYLRSMPYTSPEITFLNNPALAYENSDSSNDGGHIAWNRINNVSKYVIYALNINDITTENISDNSWIYGDKVYTKDVSPMNMETYAYFFEDGGFNRGADDAVDRLRNVDLPAGTYWISVQSIGDGSQFIGSDTSSNVIIVEKVDVINTLKLENGTFSWKISESQNSLVKGFQVFINVYVDNLVVKTVRKPTLILPTGVADADGNITYTYILDDSLIVNSEEHTFSGINESGAGETYGISVVALGKTYTLDGDDKLNVNSAHTYLDNSGNGYSRLATPVLDADGTYNKLVWSDYDTDDWYANISQYNLFLGDVPVKEFREIGFEFKRELSFKDEFFDRSGDYQLKIRSIASGSTYLNSNVSELFTAVKYARPELRTEEGVLKWDNLDGIAHQPISSSIFVYNSDSEGNEGDKIFENSEITPIDNSFEFKFDNSTTFSGGFYKAKVCFNGGFDESNNYHIASDTYDLNVFKLLTPSIQEVKNYVISGVQKECENFDSCIKWEIIKDKTGANLYDYRVEIYEKEVVGSDVYDLKFSQNYLAVNNPIHESLFTIIEKDGKEYIYYNISDLKATPGYSGEVKILVTAISTVDSSNQINSGDGEKNINYSTAAPQVTSTTTEKSRGIIKWAGGSEESPVSIKMIYLDGSLKEESVFLDETYIQKYGNIYYLPYMSTYTYIDIKFIIASFTPGSAAEIVTGDDDELTLSLFEAGDGSESSPYIIKTSEQLSNIAYRPLSHIQISTAIQSITLSSSWKMIESFSGVFDGKGKTIKNIELSSGSESALFKELTESAVVKNVKLEFATELGSSSSGGSLVPEMKVAGIAVYNYGTISGITLSGNYNVYKSRNTLYLGGVVCYNYNTIDSITSKLNIYVKCTNVIGNTNGLYAGGIAYQNESLIKGSAFGGTIDLGDIVRAQSQPVTNYYKIRQAGGIAVQNLGLILNSEYGIVEGTSTLGLISSFEMAGIAVVNKYHTALITVSDGTNEYTYQGGSILGSASIGRFKGVDSATNPSGVVTEISPTGHVYIGGITAKNQGGFIGRCYAVISGEALKISLMSERNAYVGGLVAFNDLNTNGGDETPYVENSYAIVSANFEVTGNRKYVNSLIGAYSTADYFDTDLCIKNLVCELSSSQVTESVEIKKTYANTSSCANTLNETTDTEKYAQVREFTNGSTYLILQTKS